MRKTRAKPGKVGPQIGLPQRKNAETSPAACLQILLQLDMGETAARILLQHIQGFKDYPVEFAVPPELIIRETTASPKATALRRRLRS